MDNLRLPASNSSTASGLRSGTYATLSAFVIFATGLLTVLHNVPGCSEAVIGYVKDNSIQLALMIGVPAGLLSFVTGLLNPKKPNY